MVNLTDIVLLFDCIWSVIESFINDAYVSASNVEKSAGKQFYVILAVKLEYQFHYCHGSFILSFFHFKASSVLVSWDKIGTKI